MTDTALKRFPGVTLRSDSTVYGFTLRVPKDLLHHFNGRPTVRQSLGTRDLREANDKARALHAELTHQFAALRRSDNPQKVELTEGLVRAIAEELRRWVLVADDNARDFPAFTRGLLIRHARRMEEEQAPDIKAL